MVTVSIIYIIYLSYFLYLQTLE